MDSPSCHHTPPNQRVLGGRAAVLGAGRLRACLPAGLCRVPGGQQPHGFVPSLGTGCPRCVQIEGVCSALVSLLPAPPRWLRGAACASAPHLVIATFRPHPVLSPGGAGAIWDLVGGHSPCYAWQHWRRSRPLAMVEAAAAPGWWVCSSCGERGQRQLGQGCARACPGHGDRAFIRASIAAGETEAR